MVHYLVFYENEEEKKKKKDDQTSDDELGITIKAGIRFSDRNNKGHLQWFT